MSVSNAGDVNGDGYDDVMVGAYKYDNGQTDEGRAYVYYGSPSGLSSSPNWTAEGDQSPAWFGYSVSTAGDVNGDGFDDIIVGAESYTTDYYQGGQAFVWYGSASGLGADGTPANADWASERNHGGHFANSVSTAGDVNGDGYDDVIIGEWQGMNGENSEGRAYVYYGSVSGLALTFVWSAESNDTYAYLGQSVSTAGDVNGDGYSDVVVAAPGYSRAFIWHGSTSGLGANGTPVNADWSVESIYAVSTAGDVNGDGYSEVIVGDYGGQAKVYYGSASGLSSTAWVVGCDQSDADFGGSVSSAGDVNGDGYSDVIVGAELYDNGLTNQGAAFVFHGSPPPGPSAGVRDWGLYR